MIAQAVSDAFKAQGAKNEGEMMTIDDVCRVCHITRPTFHAWVNNGIIQARKVGRRTLVKADDLNAAIQSKKVYKFKHQG